MDPPPRFLGFQFKGTLFSWDKRTNAIAINKGIKLKSFRGVNEVKSEETAYRI